MATLLGLVLNREGKDVFSDEENGTESVKIAKRLMREREREETF